MKKIHDKRQDFGSFKRPALRERNAKEIMFQNVKFKAGGKQSNTIDTSQCFVEDFKTIFSLLLVVIAERMEVKCYRDVDKDLPTFPPSN